MLSKEKLLQLQIAYSKLRTYLDKSEDSLKTLISAAADGDAGYLAAHKDLFVFAHRCAVVLAASPDMSLADMFMTPHPKCPALGIGETLEDLPSICPVIAKNLPIAEEQIPVVIKDRDSYIRELQTSTPVQIERYGDPVQNNGVHKSVNQAVQTQEQVPTGDLGVKGESIPREQWSIHTTHNHASAGSVCGGETVEPGFGQCIVDMTSPAIRKQLGLAPLSNASGGCGCGL